MNRDQLDLAIRAACAQLNEPYVVVFGSQSILGTFEEWVLPEMVTRSREVDFTPGSAFAPAGADSAEPGAIDHKNLILEAHLGEWSKFHREHGVYVDSIRREVVILPNGWDDRLVRFTLREQSSGTYTGVGMCLDPVDLCVSKSLAGRENDREFVAALVKDGIISVNEILSRIDTAGIEWTAEYQDESTQRMTSARAFLEYLMR
ncbi:DUF6036 family nucleotidyltransferase [Nocardia fluminea]|uniref:DUF6036 family nucleotidyltransferase n=1 Tax=Nocardia fluminea TaxID=134984 RepID=UPI0037246D7A